MDLTDLLEIPRRRNPEAVAIAFRGEDGALKTLSTSGLREGLGRVTSALRTRGLRPGDRVALWMDSTPEMAQVLLGVLAAGGIAVPLNLRYRRRELAHVFSDATPRWWIREPGLEAPDGVAEPPELKLSELLGGPSADEGSAAEGSAPVGDPDRIALLLYTSGTTGRSKGAMITHANLLATITSLRAAWGWVEDDVLLLALPLFHTHGLVVGLLTALSSGARVELRARFRAADVADELASGGISVFFGVPTMHRRLLEELEVRGPSRRPRGVRLVCSGSAPLPAEDWERFRELTGLEILERYGMTEAGMILSNPLAGRRRPGTVGSPLPGVAVRLVDGDGRDVADGEEGEILVRGGNVFRGYWGLPDATREAFLVGDDGRRWLRSGDLGRRDPETGVISLLGRRSELILCGGFNVYPREIEELLLEHAGVEEVAVTGEEDADLGQVPVAHLVADPALDVRELDELCARELASFKRPRRWHRVEELPRNALGKVQKHLLSSR